MYIPPPFSVLLGQPTHPYSEDLIPPFVPVCHPLKVEAADRRGIRMELVLVAVGLWRHSRVLLLAAEVLLDHVKHLLVDLYVLVRLQELYLVQTCKGGNTIN